MRIALYNLHFAALGGGERRTALLAAHLAAAHEVAIFSASPIDTAGIRALFGIELSAVRLEVLPGATQEQHAAAIAAWQPDLFINNSYTSRLPCPAPRGIYMCMFPQGNGEGLEGYQVVTANSGFTREWIRRLWGRDAEVVYSAVEPMGPPGAKERIILNVGRFQADTGHNHFKHQDALLRAFHRLRGQIGAGWEMHFVGTVGSQAGDQRYAEGLRQRADRGGVHFHFGLSQDGLRALYRRAALYWHATGCDDAAGNNPARLEHFGMTVLEAMSAGAVPLAFRGGGPCETIVHGESGLLWSHVSELREHTRGLAAQPARLQAMAEAAVARSARFDKGEYLRRMDAIVARMLGA